MRQIEPLTKKQFEQACWDMYPGEPIFIQLAVFLSSHCFNQIVADFIYQRRQTLHIERDIEDQKRVKVWVS